MIVKKLELLNYRNYEYLNIDFDSGINILYGDNAQGKTNILEALYMSGTSKSHKNAKDKETIKFGEEEAHIKTIVLKNDIEYKIDIHLKSHKNKGIAINGVPIKKATELFGVLNIIFFSPEDLNIIKEGPSERRRFIDMELCQLDKVYLHNLTNYNKILNQRNKLLKDMLDKLKTVNKEEFVEVATKKAARKTKVGEKNGSKKSKGATESDSIKEN